MLLFTFLPEGGLVMTLNELNEICYDVKEIRVEIISDERYIGEFADECEYDLGISGDLKPSAYLKDRFADAEVVALKTDGADILRVQIKNWT